MHDGWTPRNVPNELGLILVKIYVSRTILCVSLSFSCYFKMFFKVTGWSRNEIRPLSLFDWKIHQSLKRWRYEASSVGL